MKKEIRASIAEWLINGNIGLSSEAVLAAWLSGKYVSKRNRTKPDYPHDVADFKRIYDLVELIPETRKGARILAKYSQVWVNIDKFWNELVEVYELKWELFGDFLNAVLNIPYVSVDRKNHHDDRQALGRKIYKEIGFSGKRIPSSMKNEG